MKKMKKNRSDTRKLAQGFGLIILLGAFLLTLPISSRDGSWTPFLSAIFTSTSATCVTGLVVVDTYRHWSLFGQLVILALIQIGGLGFITIGAYINILLKKRSGCAAATRSMRASARWSWPAWCGW